ncbi:hypothetical protein VCHA53O473_20168 [Vibrio chagasii]|nr:hypothetical protein VCHA43P275_40063 [Vibrio chagasii]CAH7251328.1 hypothetical protein VCHA53O473_20168 [Vibrio chagasii]
MLFVVNPRSVPWGKFDQLINYTQLSLNIFLYFRANFAFDSQIKTHPMHSHLVQSYFLMLIR